MFSNISVFNQAGWKLVINLLKTREDTSGVRVHSLLINSSLIKGFRFCLSVWFGICSQLHHIKSYSSYAYKLLINFKRGGGLKSKSVTRNLLNQCTGALKSDWADIYLRLIYNNLPTAFVPTSQVCRCKSQIGIWHSCLWTHCNK